MNTWFTADHHFGHKAIIEHTNRPFSSVEEMDEAMIDRWNAMVKPTDTVWHLGDLSLMSQTSVLSILRRLNGEIMLVPGGHDRNWLHRYVNCMDGTRVMVKDNLSTRKFNGYTVTLCHYPLRSWEKSYYGALHFHGHSHGLGGKARPSTDTQLPPDRKRGWSVDVGVDVWNFLPVHLDDLIELVKEKEAEE
jgi:calcineurin-like phosphoesterase family protein